MVKARPKKVRNVLSHSTVVLCIPYTVSGAIEITVHEFFLPGADVSGEGEQYCGSVWTMAD